MQRLSALEEHRRKVELNRSLCSFALGIGHALGVYAELCRYDHLMMTTMRDVTRLQAHELCMNIVNMFEAAA